MLRPYTHFDYGTISEWGEAHGFQICPPDVLPNLGLINEGFCVGFLYILDKNTSFIANVLSNPNADKTKKAEKMKQMIDGLLHESKKRGCTLSLTWSTNEKMITHFINSDFIITDKNATVLGRTI